MSDPAEEAANSALDQRQWFGYGQEEQLALIAAQEALKPIQRWHDRMMEYYADRYASDAIRVKDMLSDLRKFIYDDEAP